MSELSEKIQEANEEVVHRMADSQISWVGMSKAIDTCPGLKPNMVMHAGPAITWDRMDGPRMLKRPIVLSRTEKWKLSRAIGMPPLVL